MSQASNDKPTAVAQLVEQRIPNPQVAGSSPSRRVDPDAGDDRSRFSFGLYKFGQGYWVRILTASMLGVLVMSTALWMAGELKAFPIPTPRWSLPVEVNAGEAAPGDTVTLRAADDTALGSAVVESYTVSSGVGRMVVGQVSLLASRSSVADTKRVVVAGGEGQPAKFSAAVSVPQGLPIFQLIYLQAGAALVILLVGGGLVYYFVGLKPATVDFLIHTDGEMKKVNWSTKKIIRDSTSVVITAMFFVAALLFVFDVGLHTLAKVIGLLDV
ncbi:MAG: hypothetical protein HBSAPP03_19510 [Phycisphaerae bacterium]|nr:MAG: hypothetical protein HBSAPP03_19510 [Phycisphaerae bacterium]